MKKMLLTVLSIAAMVGCSQKFDEPTLTEPAGQQVTITFDASYPQGSPDSKVAFASDGALRWTGTETAKLIFGKTATNTAIQPVVPSVAPGTFGGTVTIPEGFAVEDLAGVVIPADSESDFKYHSSKQQRRVRMYVRSSQSYAGEMNWNICPFFAGLTTTDLSSVDLNDYTVPGGIVLKSAADLLKFNVYGAAGEKLESVRIESAASLSAAVEYNVEEDTWVTNSIDNFIEISTTGHPVLAYDKSGGVDVWGAVICLTDRNVTKVSVRTDKAEYTKDVEHALLAKSVDTLVVYQIGLNLSTFERMSSVDYSVDGGETWVSEIPETFSTLSVRNWSLSPLTAENLATINAAIAAQSAPVALDLSGTVFEDVTFPPTFTGNKALKSIRFPSNVTTIYASAFKNCTALESVDLSGIRKINGSAFQATGLKTLNVPSSVDSIGTQAFAYLGAVETVYYNATPSGHYTSGATGFKILCNRDTNWENKDWNNRERPVTITLGPDVKEIPPYFFDTNARLTELIIEAGSDIKFWDQWAIRAFNIERIEFKGSAPTCAALGQGARFAEQLTEKEGVIVCPVGKYGEFAASAFIKKLLDSGKYRLRELGDEANMTDPVAKIEYSSDNALWTAEIPESFDKLYVRTEWYAISAADLNNIKAGIAAQSAPVDLDLSGATFEKTIFPATFKASSSAKNTTLKSIRFPSNVTTIEASAFDYCAALESVDLTGIKEIRENSFRYTGLKTVSIPSTVTMLGTYAFGYIASLEEVYCDASITVNNKNYVFSNRNTSYANASWNNADSPLKVTFGPNMKVAEYHVFDTNAKLTEVVVEASDFLLASEWSIRCMNLRRIVFKNGVCDKSSTTSHGAGFRAFENVEDGVIVVPDEYYDEFAANASIAALLALTYNDASGNPAPRFTLVKASEDTVSR